MIQDSIEYRKENDKVSFACYEWAITPNRINLCVLGVWPEPAQKFKAFRNYVLLLLSLTILTVGLLLPQAYALRFVWKNLPLLLDNICETVAVTVSLIKLIMFRINKKYLSTILKSMKFDWSKEKEDWEERIMILQGKRGRSLTICGMIVMAGAIGSISVGPFFGISLRMINNITDIGDRFLPFQSYYPYEVSKNIYFEISYLLQVISAFLTGACFSGPCSFFSVLVFHMCSQLEILATKIKQMNTNPILLKSTSRLDNNLKRIVHDHVQIIKTISLIEQSFTIVVLAQLMSVSVFVICMGVQFLSVLNDTTADKSEAILHMFLLSGPILNALLITFIYCFAGEKLSNHWIEVSNSIYGINWYMASRSFVADMSFIILHSKCPFQLTAGKIIFLNFETYCNIVKSSAGYLSMLVAVRDK